MPRKKKRKKGRPKMAALGGATARRLASELNTYHRQLAAQCASLQSEMDAIGSALAAMGTAVSKPTAKPKARRAKVAKRKTKRKATGVAGRGRRPAGGSLKDFILKTLGSSRTAVSVKDIATGVKRAGYKTKSKNLGNQVSMALIDLVKKRKVKKVGRGMYRS